MASILTNPGAEAALATLRTISSGLVETQKQIATGKRVHSAEDNAAVWAISKAMEADVRGFKRVSDSLSLGQATISVGRQAAETVTDLLTDIKGKVVAAQEENVDRSKIQNDIDALREQIDAVVDTAQFNGMYLLKNRDSTAGTGTMNILSSINRIGDEVTSSDIGVQKRDLSTAAASIAATGGTYDGSVGTVTMNATQSASIDGSGVTVNVGDAFSVSIFGTDANDSSFVQADYRSTAAATETQAEMAGGDLSYVARDGDTMSDVLQALENKFTAYAAENGLDTDVVNLQASGSSLNVTSSVTDGTDSVVVHLNRLDADAGNTIGGGLDLLGDIDVSTQDGADAALASMDNLIDVAIGAAASFGSDQGRLETQSEFVSGLTDAIKSGIGQMVDTDLEEASARLQALQVQQQLAMQALSIANSAPQVLLGLFR